MNFVSGWIYSYTQLPETVRGSLGWCELSCRVDYHCATSFSWGPDCNDSGPFMDAALLSSHNDTVINNVMFPLFSAVCSLCHCSVIFFIRRSIMKTEEQMFQSF